MFSVDADTFFKLFEELMHVDAIPCYARSCPGQNQSADHSPAVNSVTTSKPEKAEAK